MVADTGLGWSYPIAINLTDSKGSPLSGSVTGGVLTLNGPDSATTSVYGPFAIADLGNGDFGLTVPGSVLTTPGYYTWSIPTITVGGFTFTAQNGGFSVGVIPPEYRTLRAIVVAVCEALGIGVFGTSDGAGTTTTLIDSRWTDAGYPTNEFVGDELLILEPGNITNVNPVRVTASAPGSGTLTFTPAIVSVGSGIDYLLIRSGRGALRYAQIIEAIVAAVADLATRQRVTDSVTLTTVRGTREYTLPGSWLDVSTVEIARVPTAWDPYWETMMDSLWTYWPDRRKLVLKGDLGGEYRLRLTGRVGVPEPRALAALVKVPWTVVRDYAVGYLSLKPEQRAGLAFRRSQTASLMKGGW